jgi:hypothetical protein
VNSVHDLWKDRSGNSKQKKYWGRILHKDFADRLNKTADLNPNVPGLREGRLTYIQGELAKRGHELSLESVSKWFKGESKPHDSRASALAEILRVDEGWLMLGAGEDKNPQKRRVRNALADGAVNLVAGLCQMDGAVVAFPDEEDRFSIAQHIDLNVIIRGASYAIHVVVAEQRDDGEQVFAIPTNLRNTVPIGVQRLEGFNFCVYEITAEAIEMGRPGRTSKIEVPVRDTGVREIHSFAERF